MSLGHVDNGTNLIKSLAVNYLTRAHRYKVGIAMTHNLIIIVMLATSFSLPQQICALVSCLTYYLILQQIGCGQ